MENVPLAHGPVTAESPAVAQYEPALQLVHEVWPADARKKPAAQGEQLKDELSPVESPYLPDAQLVQADEPVLGAYVPAAHEPHTTEPVLDTKLPTTQLSHEGAPAFASK